MRRRPARGDGGAVPTHRQRKHLERIRAVLVSPLQPKASVAEISGLQAVGGATPLAAASSATRHHPRYSHSEDGSLGTSQEKAALVAEFPEYEDVAANKCDTPPPPSSHSASRQYARLPRVRVRAASRVHASATPPVAHP